MSKKFNMTPYRRKLLSELSPPGTTKHCYELVESIYGAKRGSRGFPYAHDNFKHLLVRLRKHGAVIECVNGPNRIGGTYQLKKWVT
jgi:hypothetical protein